MSSAACLDIPVRRDVEKNDRPENKKQPNNVQRSEINEAQEGDPGGLARGEGVGEEARPEDRSRGLRRDVTLAAEPLRTRRRFPYRPPACPLPACECAKNSSLLKATRAGFIELHARH